MQKFLILFSILLFFLTCQKEESTNSIEPFTSLEQTALSDTTNQLDKLIVLGQKVEIMI